MITYWKLHKFPILIALISVLFYYSFSYDLLRTDYIKLLSLFVALFFCCYKLIQLEKWNFKFLITIGILFRLISLVTIPNLSQDFYRFIWDGELFINGINPYLHLPNDLIQQSSITIANADLLYTKMGWLSAEHYSNYPPLNQFIFAIASFIGGKNILSSVIVMRVFIISADIGILYFGKKLLENLKLPTYTIFWYFLNPLVIIELSGNLHFEGVMLFFFVLSLYLLSLNNWKLASVFYAFSISIKLVPLLFLPIFFKYFGFKKSIIFYILVLLINVLLFIPFYSDGFIENYSETIGLWFTNFEFNASIYYIIREIGFHIKGYNIIQTVGKITPFIVIIIVLSLSFLRKNNTLKSVCISMLAALSCYYFLSTTVHPWYLIFLLLLGILADFKFPILWTLSIILSYLAYMNVDNKENLILVFFEYLPVYSLLGFELYTKLQKRQVPN